MWEDSRTTWSREGAQIEHVYLMMDHMVRLEGQRFPEAHLLWLKSTSDSESVRLGGLPGRDRA